MAKYISAVAILLLAALPALIAASSCSVTVSSRLSETQNRYNLYDAIITNVGSAPAANIEIDPSTDLRSVSGLKENRNSYSLPSSQVNKGGIAVGASYSFTYSVSKGKNVVFQASCTDGATTPSTTRSSATKAATWRPTAAPGGTSGSATSAPTAKAATSAPTAKAATAAPTSKAATSKPATAAPTSKAATSAPTAKQATAAPTAKAATKAPTTKPASPTTAPTKAATTKPSTGGGKLCPAGTVWSPAPQTTWQWQLTGSIDQNVNVQMYDIDLFDNSAATITALHAKGKAVICYFSTQFEDWRPDAKSFTSAVKGNELDGWAGENWVDIRSSVVRNIFAARLDVAVSKGCDGVEPDNVDSYTHSTGFPLTANDQLNFNRFMATEAHARGLSIGLKNDVDQISALQPAFDWALNEECNQYSECGSYSAFTNAGKAVFNAEYSGSASSVCPKMVNMKISSIIKNLDLDASIKAQCCTYQSNGCAAASYSCKSLSKRDAEEENTVYAAQALDTLELTTQEVPVPVANSAATSSFASIAFVALAAVAAMNL